LGKAPGWPESSATTLPNQVVARLGKQGRTIIYSKASSAIKGKLFSQGALIISKLHNRLNKSTIKIISCLKSWGLFKDELEEVRGKGKKKEKKDSEEGNLFFINK
jgi:hypothetical protein